VALVLGNIDPVEIFRKLDWETVFFIAGFMFIVKGLELTGFFTALSMQIFHMTGGNILSSTLGILWVSGMASALVSNTAIALTFTSIIGNLAVGVVPLWVALVLGTNMGGATTPLSGSVPILAISILKREGFDLNLAEFTKVGVITSLVQLGFSSLYLVLRFGLYL
jgi:Na+/H+ antiporter NhaD/arsenite permease-like protein